MTPDTPRRSKPFRRGTHSCVSCRRRKLRCNREAGSVNPCSECVNRSLHCVPQVDGELESTGSPDALPRGPTTDPALVARPDGASGDDSTRQAKQPEHSNASRSSRGLAPTLTLFNNGPFLRDDGPQPATSTINGVDVDSFVVGTLQKLIPSAEQIIGISSVGSIQHAMIISGLRQRHDIGNDELMRALASISSATNVLKVAKFAISLSVALWHLPETFPALGQTPERLSHSIVETVDQLVTSKEVYAASVEGIECIVLQGKLEMAKTRPRTAWILFRRALTFGQLFGLHHAAQKPTAAATPDDERKAALWEVLWTSDRYLSLLLGLPYGIDEALCIGERLSSIDPGSLDSYKFGAHGCLIMGHLVERNQRSTADTMAATFKILGELETVEKMYPREWWSLEDQRASVSASDPAELYYRRTFQMIHFYLQLMTVMPFVLERQRSTTNCLLRCQGLTAAKSLIEYYENRQKTLSFVPGPSLMLDFIADRSFDFKVFLAAVILLFDAVQTGSHTARGDTLEDGKQLEYVDLAIELLETCAKDPTRRLASQGSQTLHRLRSACFGTGAEPGILEVNVPFFGAIRVKPPIARNSKRKEHSATVAEEINGATSKRPRPVGSVDESAAPTPVALSLPTPPSYANSYQTGTPDGARSSSGSSSTGHPDMTFFSSLQPDFMFSAWDFGDWGSDWRYSYC